MRRTVVHRDFAHRAGLVVDDDLFVLGDEADLVEQLLMFLRVGVALGRALVIVERYAWRDHIDHGHAVVRDRAFENVDHLLRIAGKTARDESATELHGQTAEIHRRHFVHDAGLQLRAFVRGCRELPFRQAVHAVVLDDVDDRHIAPDHVHELAEADRCGVAVAGNADRLQRVIGEHRAGRDGGHAAMDGVETVRALEKVRRRLRGTADAGELGDFLRFHAHLEERADDLIRDRVVSAGRAERRLAALIVRRLESEAIFFDRFAGTDLQCAFSHVISPLPREQQRWTKRLRRATSPAARCVPRRGRAAAACRSRPTIPSAGSRR